jgi:hypothetical protein
MTELEFYKTWAIWAYGKAIGIDTMVSQENEERVASILEKMYEDSQHRKYGAGAPDVHN